MGENTDRQLLELAAKAAGYVIVTERQRERDEAGEGHVGLWLAHDTCWNSLRDSGAAFDLAVKLRINFSDSTLWLMHNEQLHYEPYEATRRVITRAAAAIGEAMP